MERGVPSSSVQPHVEEPQAETTEPVSDRMVGAEREVGHAQNTKQTFLQHRGNA